jgi:hypothetical protein
MQSRIKLGLTIQRQVKEQGQFDIQETTKEIVKQLDNNGT